MPRLKLKTVNITNARSCVTPHYCDRLEKRRDGRGYAIYPIFICAVTGAERSYGYLLPSTSVRQLERLYPGVPLEIVESDEPDATDTKSAA